MTDPASESAEGREGAVDKPVDESVDERAPPPMVIVAIPPPEQPVGRVIGEMTSAQARHNAVSISCGLNFAARRSETSELFQRLMHPLPARRRRESDLELLAGPAPSRRSEAPDGRVEIFVEVGDRLVMLAPAPYGICLVGRTGCDE